LVAEGGNKVRCSKVSRYLSVEEAQQTTLKLK